MQSFFVTPTDNTCYIYCLASEVYNQRESNRKLLNKFSIAMVGNKYLSSHYVDIFKAIEQVYHLGSHPVGLEFSLGVITRVVYALRVRRIIWYYYCWPAPIQELIHPVVFMGFLMTTLLTTCPFYLVSNAHRLIENINPPKPGLTVHISSQEQLYHPLSSYTHAHPRLPTQKHP